MQLGVFMQPVHDPRRDYTQALADDRETMILAIWQGKAPYAIEGKYWSTRSCRNSHNIPIPPESHENPRSLTSLRRASINEMANQRLEQKIPFYPY